MSRKPLRRKAFYIPAIFLILFFVQAKAALPAFSAQRLSDNAIRSIETRRLEQNILLVVSRMSVGKYQAFTGKKMNLFQRISFPWYKKKLAQQGGSAGKGKKHRFINWNGLIPGLLLGPVGVLLVYLLPRNGNTRLWAWIGFLLWLFAFVSFIIFVNSFRI